MSRLSRTKHSVSTPGEADETITARCKKLGLTFNEYVNSLIEFDCWAEKDHLLTGDTCRDHKLETIVWREIIADFGKPNKTQGYFERRIQQLVEERLSSHSTNGNPSPEMR